MTFIRLKQIVLKTGGILLLGSVFFLFALIPFDGFLCASEPLPSTVAPFRYKVPPPPPPSAPKELSPTAVTDAQSQPEQQAASTDISPSFDPPNISPPISAADHPADNKQTPQSGTEDKQQKESLQSGDGDKQQKNKPVITPPKTGNKTAAKSGSGSRPKSEPLSLKTPAIASSSKKILQIESDLTSPSAEMITIVLTGLYPPDAQVIEGKAPKIICDFSDVLMEKTIKRVIPIHGKYVLQIRTGIHPPPEPKTRVVIDLAPDHDYEVEQLFYEKNNRYSMIIREKP